jgi:hypothetical protein
MLLTLLQNNSSGNYVLPAEGGVYSYSGNNATLTYTTAGAFTLVADGGTYSYSGNNANLLLKRVLAADGGTYSYTGNNANLTYATVGAFVLTAEGGVYSYSGNNANLSFSGVPIVDFDTHDGDRLRRRFAADRDERKKRRSDVIAAFEALVEGKDPIVEEIVEEFTVAKATPSVTRPRIDYDKLIRDIDAVQRLWNAYIDMDDEEILLLL